MIEWLQKDNLIDKVLDFMVGELILLLFVIYCLYNIFYLNVEGGAKVASVISLMGFWGILFALWFVRLIQYFSKPSEDSKELLDS